MDQAATQLAARVPAPLAPLARIAYDLGWSWHGGEDVFRAVDPERWVACGRNPVRMLQEAPASVLARAAANEELLARIDALGRLLDERRTRPCAPSAPASLQAPVAFFCAEAMIHSCLPIYAGGLGALAGDLLKEASDRCLPLVAIGLLYRRGYMHQRLDLSGWQHEYWTREAAERLPMARIATAADEPLEIRVPIRGHDVALHVWVVQVGRVPLFLLDSDVPSNGAVDRFITEELYVGDRELRLMQYAVLGIGGVRALRALGIDPSRVHLNEGHAALASLELVREETARGAPFADALARVRRRTVFTTHTPVAAGNETYGADELVRTLGDFPSSLGVGAGEVLALGRPASGDGARFGMTELAIRTSHHVNAVSRRHGEVARAMWRPLFPNRAEADVPISYVTNGVHLRTWMAAPMRALLERHLGAGWEEHAADPWRWAKVDAIPDEEIWQLRNELRARLVAFTRERSVVDRLTRGESLGYVEAAAHTFDPAVLTVGFARRVASYKRLDLLVQNASRALGLLRAAHPIQVIIAGKAHPRDDQAKQIVQTVFALKREPQVAGHVAFLEDYDASIGAELVAGCDVWVNLPRPPLEACGTSGMKAALNGGLNLSVLDGWWCEGYDGANGWAIRSDGAPDPATQDARDADALYGILEREVVPLFYGDRDARGIAHGWVRRIKASLRSIGPAFSTGRMLNDYASHVYAAEDAAAK